MNQNLKQPDVIIVGAGPTGLSLGVELGMLGINALILERSASMNRTHPKAQQLNPRTLQFFRRWGLSEQLKAKKLIRDDYPIRYIWCSNLQGKIYSSTDNMTKTITSDLSPENYLRVPLWLTQDTLREKLNEFPNIEIIEKCSITHIDQTDSEVTVSFNKDGNLCKVSANYLVACDGADSWVRDAAHFITEFFPPQQKMLQTVFESPNLKSQITLPEATIYYNLATIDFAALSAFDGEQKWYFDFSTPVTAVLDDYNVPAMLDEFAGFKFEKTIHYSAFWLMQPLLAEKFRQQRIFLMGDAAHVLTPFGGHGLNTCFADVVNLAWKLAAVLQQQASPLLLDSYETERRTVALQKIKYITENAQKLLTIRKDYPPEIMSEKFSEENQKIAERMSVNLKLVLGDAYDTSPIIFTDVSAAGYRPDLAQAGYFAPHVWLTKETKKTKNKCLYDFLPLAHTLLVWNKTDASQTEKLFIAFQAHHIPLHILNLDDYQKEKSSTLYPKCFYLIRPDWHISWCADKLPSDLTSFMKKLLP